MKILVLGGTGAMGKYVVDIMKSQNIVHVTTRQDMQSDQDVKYIKGDAKNDMSFVIGVLKESYDAIIDFMSYTTKEFQERVALFLESTNQYVYISSARVYADLGDSVITESSPRILDVVDDMDYLGTDEYALSKARQEDFLLNNNRRNWTIVRPSLTYSESRLQLGVYEKENWLYSVERRFLGLPCDELISVVCVA